MTADELPTVLCKYGSQIKDGIDFCNKETSAIIQGQLFCPYDGEYSHTQYKTAIAERLKHALTLDLDGLENEIDKLIKELTRKK